MTTTNTTSTMSGDPSSDDSSVKSTKPVNSDNEQSTNRKSKIRPSQSTTSNHSRLFVPYRSLGLVSTGAPYYLVEHDNSSNAMAVIPIGERFHMLQCDRLHPVLVSQAVPGSGHTVRGIVSDASLSVSVVTHGSHGREATHLTLYARTRPIDTLTMTPHPHWSIVNTLHLGRTKVEGTGEKEGTRENALVVAAILRRTRKEDDTTNNNNTIVPIVGDHDDDEEERDNDDEGDDDENSLGQVVLLIATRTTLTVQRRIPLTKTTVLIQPNVALHPSTYLNKILVGGNGGLVLVNVRTSKIIHSFSSIAKEDITALEQSPAVDTVAVGTRQGKVHLINLKHDQKLFTLFHQSKITSMSFRTDGSAVRYEIAPLAVGRADGTISIWDLSPSEEGGTGRTLLTELKDIHPGGVSKLNYFQQEPLLLSSGSTSNSVMQHVFDNPDHSGRLLRSRQGHTSPPTCIQYLHPATGALLQQAADGTDASACQILSGGSMDRSLRIFSTARAVLDKEFSQGKELAKKSKALGMVSKSDLLLPPIIQMAISQTRSRDWGDLVTIHKNHAISYVWSTKQGAQSGPVLRQLSWNISAMQAPPPRHSHATSVTMSACGSFAIVGTRGGAIYKYNVQSGLPRGSFPPSNRKERKGRRFKEAGDISRTMKALEKKMKVSNRVCDKDKEEYNAAQEQIVEAKRQAKLAMASHQNATVTGLAVDSVNKTLISVGSDSKLILWNFSTHAPHKRSPYMLPAPATKMCHVRDSDLAAVALDDFTVVLFDCASHHIVRRFGRGDNQSHSGPISDVGFSPDGRTLFTSSLDSTIRVWDVPTNTCVDWMSFQTPPTSLSLSPTGEFLATTHAGRVGLSLWSDRSFYQTVHVDGANSPTEPIQMDNPIPFAEENGEEIRNIFTLIDSSKDVDESAEESSKIPILPKQDGLITMSGLPPAHWKNLFHLELVKERNKPLEAPKKPPSAPFFLQWRGGDPIEGANQGESIVTDNKQQEKEEWASAWSDDAGDGEMFDGVPTAGASIGAAEMKRERDITKATQPHPKKRKVVAHHRSHLAALLRQCFDKLPRCFQEVTDHVATLGPSAIDVSLSTLCNGMHDLEGGLQLLHMASLWLLEACQSRQRYEAVNAYLARFLYLHSNVIAGIDDSFKGKAEDNFEEDGSLNLANERKELLATVRELRKSQDSASSVLREKTQHTLCLLRHFSRMV